MPQLARRALWIGLSSLLLSGCALDDMTINSGCVAESNGTETSGAAASFQNTGTRVAMPFAITSSEAPSTIKLTLFKTGSPTGHVRVEIMSDVSGQPSNASIEDASIDVSTLSTGTTGKSYTFTFTDPAKTFTAGSYWISVRAVADSGGTGFNTSHYFSWSAYQGTNGQNLYSGGTPKTSTDSGNTWGNVGLSSFAYLFSLGC
jgi:hypothetical protein